MKMISLFFPVRGCLTQEKIVAGYASRFIVIADFRYCSRVFRLNREGVWVPTLEEEACGGM